MPYRRICHIYLYDFSRIVWIFYFKYRDPRSWDPVLNPEGQTRPVKILRGKPQGPQGPRPKGGYNFIWEFQFFLNAYEYHLRVEHKPQGLQGSYFHYKWVKNAKNRPNLSTILLSIDFPGGSEFNRAYEGPLNGAKLTVMDILKFRDINQRTLRTQISAIPSFLNWMCWPLKKVQTLRFLSSKF